MVKGFARFRFLCAATISGLSLVHCPYLFGDENPTTIVIHEPQFLNNPDIPIDTELSTKEWTNRLQDTIPDLVVHPEEDITSFKDVPINATETLRDRLNLLEDFKVGIVRGSINGTIMFIVLTIMKADSAHSIPLVTYVGTFSAVLQMFNSELARIMTNGTLAQRLGAQGLVGLTYFLGAHFVKYQIGFSPELFANPTTAALALLVSIPLSVVASTWAQAFFHFANYEKYLHEVSKDATTAKQSFIRMSRRTRAISIAGTALQLIDISTSGVGSKVAMFVMGGVGYVAYKKQQRQHQSQTMGQSCETSFLPK